MLILRCDRCKKEYPQPQIKGRKVGPDFNAFAPIPAFVAMPDKWSDIDGKHLCDRCTLALNDFLVPLPEAERP